MRTRIKNYYYFKNKYFFPNRKMFSKIVSIKLAVVEVYPSWNERKIFIFLMWKIKGLLYRDILTFHNSL